MEHWWNDTDRDKPKYCDINLCQCHSVHQKLHRSCPELNPGIFGDSPASNCLHKGTGPSCAVCRQTVTGIQLLLPDITIIQTINRKFFTPLSLHILILYKIETSVIVRYGNETNNRTEMYECILHCMISGSLSPRHGPSADCGWRNRLRFGR
jgi:hypothetical protein